MWAHPKGHCEVPQTRSGIKVIPLWLQITDSQHSHQYETLSSKNNELSAKQDELQCFRVFLSLLIIYRETAQVLSAWLTHTYASAAMCIVFTVISHSPWQKSVRRICKSAFFLPQQIVTVGLFYLSCFSSIYSCEQLVNSGAEREPRAVRCKDEDEEVVKSNCCKYVQIEAFHLSIYQISWCTWCTGFHAQFSDMQVWV